MQQILEDLKRRYVNGHLAMKLIYINVIIYIVVALLGSISSINIVEHFSLNDNFESLLKKPWSIVTYMFLHNGFFHLLFNMIMLYIMGEFFYRYFGDKAFARFYFIGGMCGGILFMLFYLLLESLNLTATINKTMLIGASAAIYSVLFAMVAYQPDLKVRLFFFSQPIKLLHVAIGFIALGFIMSAENLGGNISHVGGALFGYFYMKKFERGNTLLSDFQGKLSNLFKKRPSKSSSKTDDKPPRDDYDYADWKKKNEDKTNRILEKISRSGYSSLTASEKEFLFKQGKGK